MSDLEESRKLANRTIKFAHCYSTNRGDNDNVKLAKAHLSVLERIKELEDEVKARKQSYGIVSNEVINLRIRINELENLLSDKDTINNMFIMKIDELEAQVRELEASKRGPMNRGEETESFNDQMGLAQDRITTLETLLREALETIRNAEYPYQMPDEFIPLMSKIHKALGKVGVKQEP